MIVRIVPIAPVVSKYFETIRTTGAIGRFHMIVSIASKVRDAGSSAMLWVLKIEKRARLEERHGRRRPGSNIRCSRSAAAGKLSYEFAFTTRVVFVQFSRHRNGFFKNNSRSFVYRSCRRLYHRCRILTSTSRKLF